MSDYLTISRYKLLSIVPSDMVDDVETAVPGWVAAQISAWSNWVDSRLRKRYAAPFSEPYPETVCLWVAQLTDEAVMLRRGVDSQDEQFQAIKERATTAKEEVKEAANCQDGLFDLPLNSASTLISKGSPMAYSEQSPYVWTTKQRAAAVQEDSNGDGTYYD